MAIILLSSQIKEVHKMKKVALVTGGAGFIGSHLSSYLATHEWDVIVIDNLADGRQANLDFFNAEVELFIEDVAEPNAFAALAGKSIDVIFHLAAQTNVLKSSQDPRLDFMSNVLGTINLLEFARKEKVSKIVFPSSVAMYAPDVDMPIREDSHTHASSPYGASKAAAENYCFAYANTYNLDITVLRLFNVYGPLMNKYVIHDLVRKLQKDPKHLVIMGDGNQVRDYLYIDDAVKAFVLAAAHGKSGQVYNVGSGNPIRIRDLAAEIIKAMGMGPVDVEYTMETWPGDIKAWYADVTKLTDLGFAPKAPWKEGLKRTVQFLVNHPFGL